MRTTVAIALVVAYVALALALALALPALISPYSPAFLLRDPLADAAVVVGFAAGAVVGYRSELEQQCVGLLVAFAFAGGSVFLALQFVVPGALGNFALDTLCILMAAPGIAFATVAPAWWARRGPQ